MNTEILIDKLTKAISYRYRDDKTAPGLVVSALKKGYYCSVVRYESAFAKDKVVVCKAKSSSLTEALNDLTIQFLGTQGTPKDPVQDLQDFLAKSTVPSSDSLAFIHRNYGNSEY
jgi:hypothetical protein